MKNPYLIASGHEGEVLTYRQLCDLLGIEFKRGKGKELQLKQLRQYLDLDQKTVSRNIIIKEVYKPGNFQIVGGRGKLFPFIKNLLLQKLKSNSALLFTYSELIVELGLAPKHYIEAIYNTQEMLPFLGQTIKSKFNEEIDPDLITEDNLIRFLQMTRTMLKETIRSALHQMQQKELITVTRSIRPMRKYIVTINGKEEVRIEKYELLPEQQKFYESIGINIINKYRLKGPQELFFRATKSPKTQEAQAEFQIQIDKFVKNLGYEFYAALFIIKATDMCKDLEVDDRYLDRITLHSKVLEKIKAEKDLEKFIPLPLLNSFTKYFFSSPILLK